MKDKTSNAVPDVDLFLERMLKDLDVPPRPLIIDRIKAEMDSDRPNLQRIGQLISVDVGLAAGLIQSVNSAYFGFRKRARSVHDALLMLGLDVASRAIATLSLRRAFPVNNRLERFWGASAQIAVLSGWLAQKTPHRRVQANDAYTYGLFRDTGIAMLLLRFPTYRQTLERANADCERAFTTVEQQDFPTDHAMIGCLLARDWWLPEEICLAIRHHHDHSAIDLTDSGLPVASRHLVAISQTAEHLVQQLTGGSRTEEWQKLGGSCLRLLELVDTDLYQLHTEAKSLLASVD
ncbi:HDOD domain-containing protein [Accumulibacter sp.]|uniref:HDOD domain-containing protein n=1 Tax=Accumulibacter sp. TaxID=2053492 RepID=UPI0026148CDE|nr:HDOD domain-containing protein [Accumulibacter sp.]